MSWSLAQHSEAWVSAESDFLAKMIDLVKQIHAYGSQRGDFHWLAKEKVSLEELMKFLGLGINALYAHRAKHLRWIEQTPLYTLYVNEISTMFPGARFVHVIRDGRDVVNSMINSKFPNKWATDFKLACQTWKQYVTKVFEYADMATGRIRHVYLEAVMKDPEREFASLSDFLHLEFPKDTTEYFFSGTRINSSFSDEKERAEKTWYHTWSPSQKKQFKRISGGLLIKLGYVQDNSWD
jgi:hypothetical protein